MILLVLYVAYVALMFGIIAIVGMASKRRRCRGGKPMDVGACGFNATQ